MEFQAFFEIMNTTSSQFFRELVSKYSPLGKKGIIFVEIHEGPQAFEEVLTLLRNIKGFMDNYEIVKSEFPMVIRIRLETHEAREAVIRLTEAGFSNLKAFYPVG